MLIDEREYPVASIFNLIAKRFVEIFRERRAYVLKCKDNKFVPMVYYLSYIKSIKNPKYSKGQMNS